MKRLLMILPVLAVLTACGPTAAELPLPGSSVSGASYRISAEFENALNLPVGAQVKLHGVPIGKVEKVYSRDFKAYADLVLTQKYPVRGDVQARLRATTPLGELYVQLDDSGSGAKLRDGARIGLKATSTAPSIEDSMAATSMLLNGGNLGQLKSIVREANSVLDGRQNTIRDLMNQLTTTTSAFSQSSDDVTRILKALAGLSRTLDKRQETINASLTDIPAAAKILRDNTQQLSDLLAGIKSLGTVSLRVVDKTSAQMLAMLRESGPVLDQLLSIKDEFGPGLNELIAFTDLLDRGVPTDYLNTYLFFDDTIKLGGLPIEVPGASTIGGLGLPDLGIPKITVPDLRGVNSAVPDLGLGGLAGGLLGGKK